MKAAPRFAPVGARRLLIIGVAPAADGQRRVSLVPVAEDVRLVDVRRPTLVHRLRRLGARTRG